MMRALASVPKKGPQFTGLPLFFRQALNPHAAFFAVAGDSYENFGPKNFWQLLGRRSKRGLRVSGVLGEGLREQIAAWSTLSEFGMSG